MQPLAGVLESIDQFLNFKLNEIVVLDSDKYPHLVRTRRLWFLPFELVMTSQQSNSEQRMCNASDVLDNPLPLSEDPTI